MTYWHVETDIIALMLFTVMLIRNRNEKRDRTLQHKLFYLVLILSIVSAAIDSASALALNLHSSLICCDIALNLFMMTIPMLSLVWYCYSLALMGKQDDSRKIRLMKTASVPFLIYMIIAASNPFNRWFFSLSENLIYTRGPLYYYLGISMMLVYSVMTIVILIRGRHEFSSPSDGILLAVIFVLAASSICVEALIPGLLLVRVSYAVLYVFCSMTVENEHKEKLYRQLDRQNASLKEAVLEAQEASTAKNEFLSRMSHDIRTPMNGIIGMTRIALQQEDPAKKDEALNKIDMSSKFLLGLVNDILDMQKVDSGSMTLHEEPYLMSDFEDYIDSIIKPLYEAKHQTFHVETHAVDSVVPVMDELRFNQIMFNLLSNAVKYTHDGGDIYFSVFNELVPDHKERITAVVRDNGMGMSKEFQAVIFNQYTREDRKQSSEIQGTGLGLSIVKKLVDLMGGTITVDSELNKGTAFTVVLDVNYIESAQTAWKEKKAKRMDCNALKNMHILLCEDNELNVEIAKALLEDQGVITDTAFNGQEAVELFQASAHGYYSAILMDIRMPVMDGYTAAMTIRSLGRPDAPKIPIIAMTADVLADDVQKSADAGMNGHIAKPVDPDKMYFAIIEAVMP